MYRPNSQNLQLFLYREVPALLPPARFIPAGLRPMFPLVAPFAPLTRPQIPNSAHSFYFLITDLSVFLHCLGSEWKQDYYSYFSVPIPLLLIVQCSLPLLLLFQCSHSTVTPISVFPFHWYSYNSVPIPSARQHVWFMLYEHKTLELISIITSICLHLHKLGSFYYGRQKKWRFSKIGVFFKRSIFYEIFNWKNISCCILSPQKSKKTAPQKLFVIFLILFLYKGPLERVK